MFLKQSETTKHPETQLKIVPSHWGTIKKIQN